MAKTDGKTLAPRAERVRENGKAAPEPGTVAGIRAQLEAARAELATLEDELAKLQAERAELSESRPAVAARAHVGKDAAAAEELRLLNARLNSLSDSLAAWEYSIGEKRAQVRALEVQAAESERAELTAQRAAARAEIDAGLAAFVAAMQAAGDALAKMAAAFMKASDLSRQLGEEETPWWRWKGAATGAASYQLVARHGRHVGLELVSGVMGRDWYSRQQHAEAEQAAA